MYTNSIQEEVKELENNVFDQLPLLLAVPRAAAILGISRAAAYRLADMRDDYEPSAEVRDERGMYVVRGASTPLFTLLAAIS